MAEYDQQFDCIVEWQCKGKSWLSRRGQFQKAVCFDTKGRVVQNGGDFQRAHDEGAFPVRWLWPDQVAEMGAKSVTALRLPDEMTPAIEEALGLMSFQTGPIANAYRISGLDIRRKCEAEQAFVLFRFLRLALQHGKNWREVVGQELEALTPAHAENPQGQSNGSDRILQS